MVIGSNTILDNTAEGCLAKICSNFTNKTNSTVDGSEETWGVLRAGSKCALLKTLESPQYKFNPVQTKAYHKCTWSTLTENVILQQIDGLESNNTSEQLGYLTLLNWDISCPEKERTGFYNKVLAVIQDILPDFCCFQNVQHDFRAWLKNSAAVRQHYYLSNSNLDYIDFEAQTHHGLLTITRWPCEFMEYPFIDTQVGGYLLACQTVVNGMPVVVAHSRHGTRQSRAWTVQHARDILSEHPNVVWLGEFGEIRDSISSYQDMEEIAEGKHSDHEKILIRSGRVKPAHYFNLKAGLEERRGGIVGVVQLLSGCGF